MSGSTRCNVTNKTSVKRILTASGSFMCAIFLRSFSNTDTIRFFKDLGVELTLEPTGKYFPSTNSGKNHSRSAFTQDQFSDEHHTFMRE